MSNEYKRPAVVLTEEMKRAARNAPLPMVLLDSISARQDLEFESKFYAAIAAAPQPPATELVAAGLNLQLIVTEALIGMIAAVTSTSPPANEPPPAFIQAGIDRAVSRISAHLAPLQAEIERHKYKAELYDEVWNLATGLGYMNVTTAIGELRKERDRLKARCDELEALLLLIRDQPALNPIHRARIKTIMCKPAGGEQV
ncbi:hypothetical protein NLO72_07155 [Pseudomonas tremae]|uniref:hypothetical protein n=1 Tax=Pseudomonas syringae group TaxID=136849 RepID=UPI0001AF456F|nr:MULTISPECIES: hypothetical protein [Pseudomonas syringae group]MCQ2989015.1 hypothetical protein [Pseudomonas tremae]MCQ3014862.1 hypothetical protein [Pseudomonas tremae]